MMIPIANVLQPLIDVAEAILKFWHDDAGFSWGASIIMLTVVVRLAILPLTFKQVRSMQELQRLQPEMKRIQERYKEDRQRMNQEMMKLYQEHKVNPLGSCLPILLQLPFFISLFYLLRGDEFQNDIRGRGELPLHRQPRRRRRPAASLVDADRPLRGDAAGLEAVTTVTADPTQRRIMLALPFVFVIFIINFEAGLIVYWITTNVWTIGQQLLVRKLFPKPPPIAAKVDAGSKPARGKPPAKAAASPTAGKGEGREGQATTAGRRRARRRAAQEEEADRQEALAMEQSDPRAEAEGATVGEAKRAAFKELERDYPGLTPGRRRVRGARGAGRGRGRARAGGRDRRPGRVGGGPRRAAGRARRAGPRGRLAGRAGARARGHRGHRGDAPRRSARR